jgi:hypothetical protein
MNRKSFETIFTLIGLCSARGTVAATQAQLSAALNDALVKYCIPAAGNSCNPEETATWNGQESGTTCTCTGGRFYNEATRACDLDCLVGEYLYGGKCTPCPTGSWSLGGTPAACRNIRCPAGQYRHTGTPCPPGTYLYQGSSCPAGTYKANTATSGLSCPAGNYAYDLLEP